MHFARNTLIAASSRPQVLVNVLVGLLLIAIGGYHTLAGGPDVERWLESARPALAADKLVEGRLGFEMGGYLAIAVGLSFIVIGRALPRSYYLFWAVVFFVIGAISLYGFLAFHVSQSIWFVTALLGGYYLRSDPDTHIS